LRATEDRKNGPTAVVLVYMRGFPLCFPATPGVMSEEERRALGNQWLASSPNARE
jgi:hypothetical protein